MNLRPLRPEGVRQAWIVALDEAVATQLVVHRNRIRSVDVLGTVTYYRRSELRPECSPLTATIWLKPPVVVAAPDAAGSGFEGIRLVAQFPLPGAFAGPQAVEAPALGVNPISPAARDLMDDLCRHLLDLLAEEPFRPSSEYPNQAQ